MIRNYFKVAFRNLARYRMLSLVNIVGLAIALVCVMLIVLFVQDEWSFDRFHTNGKNIYRLVQTTTDSSGNERKSGNTGLPHGPVFAAEVPGIAAYCRIKGWEMTTRKGTSGVKAQVVFADPSIFSIFSIGVLKGNEQRMLDGRNSVVLSAAAAEKYFGNADPMGKTVDIEVDDALESFAVTGVVTTPPSNSSIQFEMLIPFERQNPTDAAERNQRMQNWHNLYLNSFFLLDKNADPAEVERKLWKVYLQHNGGSEAALRKSNSNSSIQLQLQPLFSMHLDKDFFASNGLAGWSDASYSYILSGLAGLILLIACINFINIALARGIQRGKEIGIRKVSGSSRRQIAFQFLSESLLVTLLAFAAAMVLLQPLIPLFNSIANRQYSFSYLLKPAVVLSYAGLIVVVALLAGAYPALVAAGVQPVQILYGRFKLSSRNWLGKSLVIVQFSIATALIIGTFVLHRQFSFLNKADLGYNPHNMIYLQFPWDHPTELQRFKQALMKSPAVQMVGTKSGNWNKTLFTIDGKQTGWTYYENIDDQYLQCLQIPLVKGRYLSYNNPADTIANCMVNEAFVKAYLHPSADAVGQVVNWQQQPFTIAGVVKDYHSANFKERIEPIFFSLDTRGDLLNTYVKYLPGQEKKAGEAIASCFHSVLPFATLEYHGMKDWLMDRYAEDQQWKTLITFAAGMAILIAALGLFALAALSVQQRTREVGIRKILGASLGNIALLLSTSFLKLIVVSLAIAVPVALWGINEWLQDFAYRIDVEWWIIAVSGLLVVLVAMITISYQAIQAAAINPASNIKTN